MAPPSRGGRDDEEPMQGRDAPPAAEEAEGLRVESDRPPVVVQQVPVTAIDETELMRDTLMVATSATPPRDRKILALTLLIMVGVIVMSAGIGIAIVDPDKGEVLERALGVVFGPLVTLLGTSFTWYYASAPWRNEARVADEQVRDS